MENITKTIKVDCTTLLKHMKEPKIDTKTRVTQWVNISGEKKNLFRSAPLFIGIGSLFANCVYHSATKISSMHQL